MPDSVREGAVFTAEDDDSELVVIGAGRGWGHRALIVKDNRSGTAKLIDPAVLFRRYQQSSPGEGEEIPICEPPPVEITEPSLAFGGRPPEDRSEPMSSRQASYLRSLCKQSGIRFDPKLGRAAASRLISKLKRQLEEKSAQEA